MEEIIVGEKVLNKLKEAGTIVSFDGKTIVVQYENRVAKLQSDAFDKGFITYAKAELQSEINKRLQRAKEEKEDEARAKNLAEETAKEMRRMMEAQAPVGVKFNSVSLRLEPASASFASVKKKHKDTVQKIFDECDKDVGVFYDSFKPNMRYITPPPRSDYNHGFFNLTRESIDFRPSYYRSRYCIGFLMKHGDAYVIRVFSRNDVYTPGRYGGFTVTNSDTTEIIRAICIDGELYCFSKHITCDGLRYKNTTLYKKWQASHYLDLVVLDEVIRMCDCKYLNDYVEEKEVNCLGYIKLLASALYDNKVEILFKNKRFSSVLDIDNISDYLKEFTSKQIDFASKNNVINSLPIIKECGLFDAEILKNVEALMKKGRNGSNIYNSLVQFFVRRNLDVSILNKKLVSFLRSLGELFDPVIYGEYISEIARNPHSTMDDAFDKDYCDRHWEMMQEKYVYHTRATENQYAQAAAELSWIDREENDYHIIVPKSIEEFKYEGQTQHICVYSMEYFKYVINQESIIVFLRKSKNIPYVTIEFDYNTFEVIQARGKYNSSLYCELYEYIVNLGKRLYEESRAYERSTEL